ncbi:MAG: hypothetical protein SF123_08195 [Chloroflexota bacterium]|nr:hypothetical protein [Chloroflexota bacterium]
MSQRLLAQFENYEAANRAVDDLAANGVARSQISLIAGDRNGQYSEGLAEYRPHMAEQLAISDDEDVKAGEGAGFGAVVGTAVGLGVALIPGIGPVLALGPFAAALIAGIGAASGAVTGGVVAGLIHTGLDERDVASYQDILKRGGALVVVDVEDDRIENARAVLFANEALDVNRIAWGDNSGDDAAELYLPQAQHVDSTEDVSYTSRDDMHNAPTQKRDQVVRASDGVYVAVEDKE